MELRHGIQRLRQPLFLLLPSCLSRMASTARQDLQAGPVIVVPGRRLLEHFLPSLPGAP